MNAILWNEQSRLMREMMLYAIHDSFQSQSEPICRTIDYGLTVFLSCSYIF